MRLAVIMTCHNRRQFTLRCLGTLFSQNLTDVDLEVFLVDDGSTDGTSEAVKEKFSSVNVIPGSGQLFWAGGMRKAWAEAAHKPHEFYLWLNDDVSLDEDAISRLISLSNELGPDAIVGGSMRDPSTEKVTYSAANRRSQHGFAFSWVDPSPSLPTKVDVLNGNIVLIPLAVHQRLGNMAEYLIHNAGDFEYCLRAAQNGIGSFLAPGTFGTCSLNPVRAKKYGMQGLRRMMSEKEHPPKAVAPLYRRYAGPFWPFWMVASYAKAFILGH